jgi:hypothetical protein
MYYDETDIAYLMRVLNVSPRSEQTLSLSDQHIISDKLMWLIFNTQNAAFSAERKFIVK